MRPTNEKGMADGIGNWSHKPPARTTEPRMDLLVARWHGRNVKIRPTRAPLETETVILREKIHWRRGPWSAQEGKMVVPVGTSARQKKKILPGNNSANP